MNGDGTTDGPTLGTATNGTTYHRYLCIKRNNTITNDPCAICRERCDPTGIDLFLDGTDALVCDFCGWELDPQLRSEAMHSKAMRSEAMHSKAKLSEVQRSEAKRSEVYWRRSANRGRS